MQHQITTRDLKRAQAAFELSEPRGLFYRAATELVDLALRGGTSLSVAEALAVLLQTWNKARYQYRKFDSDHFADIDSLLVKHRTSLAKYRTQAIDQLTGEVSAAIATLFHDFESVLGPVGAAKALHLLAPSFFPLWDRAIAKAYGLSLGRAGTNGPRYWRFMEIARHQCCELSLEDLDCPNPLKAIDEYNYCRYTKGWLS
jgi:hypothetical protein